MLKFQKCIDWGEGGGSRFRGNFVRAFIFQHKYLLLVFFCLFGCLVGCRSVILNASDADAFLPKKKLINGKVPVPSNY